MSNPIRLISGFFTVGAWTFLSRIAGFAREIMIAAFFGAGPIAEAFQVAFALPNMFRRFFAEGAFNMAFVPMFSKKLERGEDPEGFAEDAFAALATILIVFTLIAMLVMPWLVLAMASGFAGDERLELATFFGRICFPYILLISLAALLSGVLNASGRFALAAAAPVFLNIIFIAFMVAAWALGWNVANALVWAVPVAGVVQLGLVWWGADQAGIRIRPRMPRFTPEMKRLAIIAAPAALAGGVVQINLLVGRQVSSYFDGAIQWLAVADRLYQLPLGVVGIAIGIVLLPDLSRKLGAKDTAGAQDAFNRATEFSIALTVPAAVALVVLAWPLTSVLFERGAFTATDSQNAALALAIYGLGLPAFVLQKTLQPLFFAREDTKTPFRLAVVAMVVNAAIAIIGAPIIGFIAAAWATTLSAWVMVALLWQKSRAMGQAAELDQRLIRNLPKFIAVSLVMGAVLWIAAALLDTSLRTDYLRYGALALLVTIGIATYGGGCFATGALTRSDLGRLRNRS